jgi:MinD superfamily P-loop ATPase
MKEVVIISGKGGTGKTSIAASFAYIGGENVVVADCDVDAADMHLLLKPDYRKSEEFYSGLEAKIDQDKCIQCGDCYYVCRFNAIKYRDTEFKIDQIDCEGCGLCAKICPTQTITMLQKNSGTFYISNTRFNNKLIHAKLHIGAENSGKLVAKVKNEAKKKAEETGKEIIIVDGSPGIGCPVISSLSGADFILLVTEPTISALHDLKRVVELIKKFNIPSGCIINKADLNEKIAKDIENYLMIEKIILFTKINYDEDFTKAMIAGKTIVEFENNRINGSLTEIWNKIVKQLNQGKENDYRIYNKRY